MKADIDAISTWQLMLALPMTRRQSRAARLFYRADALQPPARARAGSLPPAPLGLLPPGRARCLKPREFPAEAADETRRP